ncbi:GspE/PulE family protein [Shewanella sp. FJAT-52076]|uniref:GspE/PulE family protein n=1 Tax=Shewanella sp. FJAT-52076 TaxID=2864202 RepID=UPI001C6555B3|nr:GspE/PulE family protein [Shewanella sp. FJAT-52076]QYJ74058.1 GspE/PulE family protein [Shewanella sp. FJAT-52076]
MTDIGKLLTGHFSVEISDFEKALAFQAKYGGRVESILVNIGALSEESLPEFYSLLTGLPIADEEWVSLITYEQLQSQELNTTLNNNQWYCVPADAEDGPVTVLCRDPLDVYNNQFLNQQNISYRLEVATLPQLQRLSSLLKVSDEVNAINGEELSDFEEDKLRELASEAPTVNLLNSLIAKAIKMGSSDMHLEPVDSKYRVRFRIDGVLQTVDWVPGRMRLPLASRLKILAGMDIAEKRRPQDGKIAMKVSNEDLDIRVSSLPLNDGESIVMRFLRQESINYDMDVLGLSADIQAFIREDIKKTAGVILLTGPTGSGKTTSLYTFLNEISDDTVKVITLEDPVEYQLDGVNQVQINADIGFGFAEGLRSIVRQDPDVIMVGEIRDKQTAQIAMQSALTGHLVFSTVHTNDAPSAYTRLLDLGAEEYLLNAAIISIIAQRLVRKLCLHCALPDPDAQKHIEQYQLQPLIAGNNVQLKIANGCDHCGHTGYKGRIAIVEYLRCDEDIKTLGKDQYFPGKARNLNISRGGRTLMMDGLLKAAMGQTTIEEVVRVAG